MNLTSHFYEFCYFNMNTGLIYVKLSLYVVCLLLFTIDVIVKLSKVSNLDKKTLQVVKRLNKQ